MHWGDAQAIFQLIIGINIAFYGFREIRRPVEEKERRALSRFREVVSSKILVASNPPEKDDLESILTGLIPLYNAARLIRKDTEQFDSWLENGALVAIVLGTVALFRSAYQYGQVIDSSGQILLFLGFLPPFGAIVMNLWTIGRTKREMTRPRQELAGKFDELP